MRIGFIGTGSMGGMLARAYSSIKLSDLQIAACNRSQEKLRILRSAYPDIELMQQPQQIAALCDITFLCVKPKEAREILEDIKYVLLPDQYLISINSAIPLSELEETLTCKVTKIIPSITQEAASGVILTMLGKRLNKEDQTFILEFLGKIGRPFEIDEQFLRIGSDITSCGPAFFSLLIEEFIHSAARIGKIPLETAELLTTEMLRGMFDLIYSHDFSTSKIMERVSVPGGITEAGLRVLQPQLPNIFDSLFQETKTHQHHHKKP